MPTPEPKLPWYQFSLRSLFLLTVFVALLCSIGVCTDWSVAAVIGVGSITGGIIARNWRGMAVSNQGQDSPAPMARRLAARL